MGLISRVSSRTYRNIMADREQVVDKYKNILTRPAQEYVNDASIEMQWAEKAFKEAEVHYKLFRRDFPDFNVEKIDEDKMKTTDAKAKWRPFCNHFQGQVDDYNRGSLVRIDGMGPFDEVNSTLTTRIQFLAIEIARNREGVNDKMYEKLSAEKANAEKPKAGGCFGSC